MTKRNFVPSITTYDIQNDVDDDSPASDLLADLLFGGADKATVAEHLRTVRDSLRANDIAEWLVMCRDALPVFRRAEADGHRVLERVLDHQQVMAMQTTPPFGMPEPQMEAYRNRRDAEDAEYRRLNELNTRHGSAECAMLEILKYAPALMHDTRSQQVGDVADSAAIIELRMKISNYLNEKKLHISRGYDGWPHCESPDNGSLPAVRLVTVSQKGLRTGRG